MPINKNEITKEMLEKAMQCKVSLGYCAQIAGMTKEAFIRYLGENGVSVFQYDDKNEFIEEMNNA